MQTSLPTSLAECHSRIGGSVKANVLFTCITPSFKQLDWLRLCIASVRDQVEEKANGEKRKAEISDSSQSTITNAQSIADSIHIEHIIQDAGSPGIEEFAREVGADFYRDGELVFASAEDRRSKIEDQIPPSPISDLPSPKTPYRLAIFSEPDQGMYDAVNRGFRKGTGELCAYLNCDEQYLPNTIAKVCGEFERYPGCEVLFGDAILVDPSGGALSYRKTVLPEKTHVRLCHLNTLTCTTFFRRSVLERGIYFGDTWKVIGDAVWVHRCLEEGCAMRVLDEPLSTFCFTGQNLSEQDLLCSESEQARWSKAPGAPARWLKPLASLRHRARKALSGAYRQRDVDYAIHTTASRNARTLFSARKLGAGWPGQTAGIV